MTNQSDPGPLPEFDPGTEVRHVYTVELTEGQNAGLQHMARDAGASPEWALQDFISTMMQAVLLSASDPQLFERIGDAVDVAAPGFHDQLRTIIERTPEDGRG